MRFLPINEKRSRWVISRHLGHVTRNFFPFFQSIIVPASFQQFNRILAVLSAMENKQQKLFESLRKNEVMRLFEQSLKYLSFQIKKQSNILKCTLEKRLSMLNGNFE